MKLKTTLKSPVLDFVKERLAYNFAAVTGRVTGSNYNCNVFFFFINRNMTINTYFVKMLLKTILKMSCNTYTGSGYSFLKKLVKS